MLKYLFIGSILLLTMGCAHESIHEYCSDPENADKYQDYKQCYSEQREIRTMKRQAILNRMQQDDSEREPAANKRKCVTERNEFGVVETTCQNSPY